MAADEDLLWQFRPEHLPAASYPCAYLPPRTATAHAFTTDDLPAELYHDLMDRGFRRSGAVFYAMRCEGCRQCVPLRVPVSTFAPSRSQRRTWRNNQDLRVEFRTPRLEPGTFELYCRYLADQHPGTLDRPTVESFRDDFYARVVNSVEARYLLGEQLLAVSMLDVCSRSVSAVYHFFDPEYRQRRLGVFSVLAEIEFARARGVPHYYLGHWIRDAKSMRYKADYRPHQLLVDDVWSPAAPIDAKPGDDEDASS